MALAVGDILVHVAVLPIQLLYNHCASAAFEYLVTDCVPLHEYIPVVVLVLPTAVLHQASENHQYVYDAVPPGSVGVLVHVIVFHSFSGPLFVTTDVGATLVHVHMGDKRFALTFPQESLAQI